MWESTEARASVAAKKGALMEEVPDISQKPEDEVTRWIQVHQIKGNYFRVIHADGVWLSVSPDKFLHLTFYSERHPLPKSISFPVNKAGTVMDEDVGKRDTLTDWVREMEVDVVLSLKAAQAVRAGLETFINLQTEATTTQSK
jgi:hypothetical protein